MINNFNNKYLLKIINILIDKNINTNKLRMVYF